MALSVENIIAGYQEGIDILNGVTLKVRAGSITGIIGPNGAGKSTLLKTIFGFLHPRQGRITLKGQEIQSLSPHQLKDLGISYVPQQINTFPQLTVRENLMLGAWIYRRDRRRLKETMEAIYAQFPILKTKRGRKAAFLSGGELRMLSIAKEVIAEPKILLTDEPSAGLAPKIVSEVYDFIQGAKDRGVTILLVDQNIAKAVEVSDYMYLLEMGRIKMEGPQAPFKENIREIIKESLMAE